MNFKRIMMIAIPIIVIAVILYIMKLRNDKYYKINPIFHPLGKDAKKEDIVEEKEIVKSSKGNDLTFHFWMYIKDYKYNHAQRKNIITKGPLSVELSGGLNDLVVSLNREVITVPHIPMKEWVHVSVVLRSNTMEVYVDGLLKGTKRLSQKLVNLPGPLNMNRYGGFDGMLSLISYTPKSLPPEDIRAFHARGPLKKTIWQSIFGMPRKLYTQLVNCT